MSSKVTCLAASIRLDRWWKPKAANLLAILYSVTLLTGLPFFTALPLILASLVTIVGIGGFGHVINDACDIEADAVAGTANRLARAHLWQRSLLLLALLLIGILPWWILPFDHWSLALLLLEFVLLLAYAVPPIRLKERGVLAVIADAVYAYAIPAVLAAHTFFLAAKQPDNRALIVTLLVWQPVLGIRHFLNHLAVDRENDLRSGISTLATRRGNRFIHSVIRHILLPLETLGLIAYLLVMSVHARWLVFIMAGVFLLSNSFQTILMIGRGYSLFTYRFSRTHLDWLYQNALPLLLVLYLLQLDWRFWVLLLVHLLLFAMKAVLMVLQVLSLPFVLVAAGLKSHFSRSVAPEASLVAESLPSGTRGESTMKATKRIADRANIAIVNINKGKYTETFINGVLSRLRYNIYYLYGDELPRFDDEDRHFLSNWPILRAVAEFLEVVLRLEKNQILKSSISGYLQAKAIRLVLAEFGPVGNEMLPITQDLGIPLIVYFHGYDAFNQEMLTRCGRQYANLFREAARIIGVSEVMLERLRQLGAPSDKLVHLPAFVDLSRFPCCDHSGLRPRFLAVGRFAETKSPHLTLLAFQQVAQAIPEATLTMVGKGGGGELFEACVILAKALGLQNRVEFKGVLSHEEVATEMRQARAFVQHSVTTPEQGDMEGKPVAVMEAMASGLPVVTTRHSGIPEIIEHEVTGLLVPEYDVSAMASAMIRLAKNDELVQQIGRRASAFIHGHPLISRHVEILEEIVDRCIAES